MKTKIFLLKIRLKMAFRILFTKDISFVMIDITKDELKNLLLNRPTELNLSTYKLHSYLAFSVIKIVAKSKDDLDMILDKAAFVAEAEILQKDNNKTI